MLRQAEVSAAVQEEIERLLTESTGEAESVAEQDNIYEIGFNSLLLARLLVQLEDAVGIDPFTTGASLGQVRSVAELVDVYKRAIAGAEPSKAMAGEGSDHDTQVRQ
jgi:acyl carrier protein